MRRNGQKGVEPPPPDAGGSDLLVERAGDSADGVGGEGDSPWSRRKAPRAFSSAAE